MLSSWVTDQLRAHGERSFITHGEEGYTYAEALALVEQVAAVLSQAPARAVPILAGRNVLSHLVVLGAAVAGKVPAPLPSGNDAATRSALERLGVAGALDLREVKEPATAYVAQGMLERAMRTARLVEGDGGGEPSGPELAYVLFTSGSTGVPKGVPVKSSSLVSYVERATDRFSVAPDSRLSATFLLNFDVAMHDLFCTVLAGASVHLPLGREFLLPSRYVARARLSHWFSVPSVVRLGQQVQGLAAGSMPDLGVTIFAGEALTVQDLERWRAAAPGTQVHNLYGPTECTIGCFSYEVPRGAPPRTKNGTVPIGTPLPGVEFRIGDPGSDDSRGELLVRGAQRFDGYLGLGATYHEDDWYRTGDVVESLEPSAVVVFLGRTDRQVKLHGHRVELGEVEFLVRECPGITDARAEVGPSGALTIVCESTEDEETVRAAVASGLPPHMRGRVLVLEAFPLTPNGKTDTGRIAEMVSTAPGSPGQAG